MLDKKVWLAGDHSYVTAADNVNDQGINLGHVPLSSSSL